MIIDANKMHSIRAVEWKAPTPIKTGGNLAGVGRKRRAKGSARAEMRRMTERVLPEDVVDLIRKSG